MEQDEDFDTLVQNAILYGMGVLVMDFKDGKLQTRAVPIEEYTEVGEHMEWIDQSTKDIR